MFCVSIHGLLRALTGTTVTGAAVTSFNPRALTSPDRKVPADLLEMDVSIHGLLRALTYPYPITTLS